METLISLLGEEDEWEEMVKSVSPLLTEAIRVLMRLDAAGTGLRVHALDPCPALIRGGSGGFGLVDLADHPTLLLRPGQTLRFVSTDLGRRAESGSAPLDVERWEDGELPKGLTVLLRGPDVSG